MKKVFSALSLGAICAAFCAGDSLAAPYAYQRLSDDYSAFKQKLQDEYGISYQLDYSVMFQRTAPSGKHNAVQSYLYPEINWTTFDNHYGTGTLNFAYDSVYYGNHNADDLANNSGFVTSINDFPNKSQEFAELYYTYQLPGKYNWLTFGLGQYSLYNFNGGSYNSNQQATFINYALSQNATATYTTAGVGAYVEIAPQDWVFTFGAQDASDIDATSVRVNSLDDKHYTTFGSVAYNPTIKGLGQGQYSVMVYNQPSVSEQPETTNGWSVNLQQAINEKFALFGSLSGVSGSVATIDQSYTIGAVYNNPLDRNELDQIGLAYAYNHIDETAVGSEIYHSAEQVIEAYWAWGVGKWVTITPDIQMYINPALNQNSDYGFASTLRFSVFF